MKSKALLMIALLLAPMVSMFASGDAVPQVIWCEGNTTLYFLHSENTYYEGDTYDGQEVTESWRGSREVLRMYSEWGVPQWSSEEDYPEVQEKCTRVVFDSSFAYVFPYSTFKWFANFTKLKTIEGIEYLNTSHVKVMNSMFYKCLSLESINVDLFDVSHVVNAVGMFTQCEKLKRIYCGNTWNIAVTTGMFIYCTSLPHYDQVDGDMANPTTGYFTKPNTAYFEGSGVESIPYLIKSVNDMNHLATKVNMGETYSGCYFELAQDLEYDNSTVNNYSVIGRMDDQNDYHYFCGVFNGRGHRISNIDMQLFEDDYTCSFVGLFGLIGEGGVVKNLTLDNSHIVGYQFVAGIAGYNMKGTVENCHVTKEVDIHACQQEAVAHGSIVGENNHGTIVGCTSGADVTVNVEDFDYFGGIVGYSDGTVRNCLYYGNDVVASSYSNVTTIGAIVGANASEGSVENCLYTYYRLNRKTVGVNAGTVTHAGKGYAINLADGVTVASHIATIYPTFGVMPAWCFFVGGAVLYDNTYYAMKDDVVAFGYYNDVPNGYAPTFVVTDELENEVAINDNGQITMPESEINVDVKYGVGEWTGTGTEEDPYVIYTTGQLDLLSSRVNANKITHYEGKYFILANDLEYDGTENNYTPIGFGGGTANYFGGTFDGRGHTISGINVNNTEKGRQALFSVLSGATVKNLTLANSSISGNAMVVGGIAAYTLSGSTIENCHVTADVTITASGRVGGIVGHCSTGDTFIYGCSSAASVNGLTGSAAGGIAGYIGWETTGVSNQIRVFIENCLYSGRSVEGSSYVGAIGGKVYTDRFCSVSFTNNYYTTKRLFGCGNENGGADITDHNGAVRGYASTEKPEDIGQVVKVYGEGTAEGIIAYEKGLAYESVYYGTTNPLLKYDINHDGYVNISDVVALVEIVLGKDDNVPYQYDHQAADVDGSGGIDISDVVALVTIILEQDE